MANQNHAHRLLQCLVVAVRPLRIEELAEILAFDFEEANGATPELNTDWRLEDRQRAVLSACSSLITLVDNGYSRVIQFSHFSVKEFLTSDRLASSRGDASHLHITAEPAHTTLVQACLGTLLQLDGHSDNSPVKHIIPLGRRSDPRWVELERSFPLAVYASQHWVEHAQFGKVSSRIEDGMRRLFDSDQPYFSTWIQLHDLDEDWNEFADFREDRGSPLYYASLCGFRDLAAHIIAEHPEQVNQRCGRNHSPLAAALYTRHLDIAELLHQHGADVDLRCHRRYATLLYAASFSKKDVHIVRWLLGHGSDAESENEHGRTPIMAAAMCGHLETVQALLEHGIRINATNSGLTALSLASYHGHVNIMWPLLQHGADTEVRDWNSRTPLHVASLRGQPEVVRPLLDNGANIEAKNELGMTPLHLTSYHSAANAEVVCLLLDRGANPNALALTHGTPLHLLVASEGKCEVVRLLLDRGADAEAQDVDRRTPLHLALHNNNFEAVCLLLDRGANAEAQDKFGQTPLHQASTLGSVEVARLLLDCGANVNALDNYGCTPLHLLGRWVVSATEFVRLLLDRGACVDVKDNEGETPVQHLWEGSPEAQMLIEAARHWHDAQVPVDSEP